MGPWNKIIWVIALAMIGATSPLPLWADPPQTPPPQNRNLHNDLKYLASLLVNLSEQLKLNTECRSSRNLSHTLLQFTDVIQVTADKIDHCVMNGGLSDQEMEQLLQQLDRDIKAL